MRILVTGNQGLIGKAVESELSKGEAEVIGYDLKAGYDILDSETLVEKSRGCQVLVHLAALLGRDGESAEAILRTNVLGTWNVLETARIHHMEQVIFLSSVDALGIFKGEGLPEYFPIDDDHPCRPTTSYAISKKLAEEMCGSFSKRNGIHVVCFRPPGVWTPETYSEIIARRHRRPEYEWDPYWEYGAFVDVRDLAHLIRLAIHATLPGFHYFLVASDDITTSGLTSRQLATRLFPNISWKPDSRYEQNPFASILDCSNAKRAFGWKPEYTWQRFMGEQWNHRPPVSPE